MKKSALLFLFFLSVLSMQAQQYRTGMLFDDAKYDSTEQKATLTTRSFGNNIPASASLKKYAPYPKSQGQTGTCVAWSSAYAARTIVEAKKNNWIDRNMITEKAFSPGFLYSQIKESSDYNCQNGTYIEDAMETMKTKGVPYFNTASELCYSNVNQTWYNEAQKFKINDYAKLFGGTETSDFKLQSMKKSLSEGNPVVIGMYVTNSFYNAKEVWNPTENVANNLGGHAMCIIGYDDNKFGGAFEVQNSWGEEWGDNGYTWIRYNDFINYTKYAFEMVSFPSQAKGNKFAGNIEYILPTGKKMDATFNGSYYTMKEAYNSGTQFRILINNEQPAFVYAIGSDGTNQIFKIFPFNNQVSAALNYSSNEVPIPDESHFIEMDNTLGDDYMCVLFSREALDIDRDIASLQIMSGSFTEKITKRYGAKIIPAAEINYSNNKIEFKSEATEKTIAVLMVKIKHIK